MMKYTVSLRLLKNKLATGRTHRLYLKGRLKMSEYDDLDNWAEWTVTIPKGLDHTLSKYDQEKRKKGLLPEGMMTLFAFKGVPEAFRPPIPQEEFEGEE
jgi:hypothetical protein